MSKLAILGGKPVIKKPLPPYPSMSRDERKAVVRVINSGLLSGFYGSWGEEFFGGPEVRALEKEWSSRFSAPYSVSVNSATSGLIAAVGALGIGPGDEVIVSPYTMSATAMAPLFYGGIPVFADIEPETYGLNPARVEAAVTPKTRAIMVTNLFGHVARLRELKQLAERHGLTLIEDCAQSPLATEGDVFAGLIGDIGVFSLNVHKHIHSGEGGICVTKDEQLARRLQLIRNHGENAAEALGLTDLTNLVGQNYRMTELSAAVARAQLAKADQHVGVRERLAETLTAGMAGLDGITPPAVRAGCRHVYYLWTCQLDAQTLGVSRAVFARALAAEGVPLMTGYVPPLYRLPLFRQRVALGKQGFPFSLSQRSYENGLCPVTEHMHDQALIGFEICAYAVSERRARALVDAFHKVYRQRAKLRGLAEQPQT